MGKFVTLLAYHMVQLGVKTYDRVIFQLFNGPEVCYLFYACMKIGAIPICSLVTHRWAEISFYAEATESQIHAIPAGTHLGFDYEKFADEIRNKIPSMETVLTVGKPSRANMISINELIEKYSDQINFKTRPLEEILKGPYFRDVLRLSVNNSYCRMKCSKYRKEARAQLILRDIYFR